ncbi:hypothetical protein [Candidatus Enterococcus mansonii]|uniref:Uncharacterized protein n=1 Tax=Candidatus Enterococcus mansonii TaxID=1834181 RepID=A0A242CEA9_9ENTE|nr:hypothetical protein [Enterococcus sp. 4G2_DIV0659]OTO08575.1 hypothetical protein A5880_001575 [Enterococcus sp. 4G2_DIV0659]
MYSDDYWTFSRKEMFVSVYEALSLVIGAVGIAINSVTLTVLLVRNLGRQKK